MEENKKKKDIDFLDKTYLKISNALNDEEKTKKSLFSIFITALIIIASIFLIELALVVCFYDIDKLGAFGDFFGGMINPLLTFCTFMALLLTIILQQRELKLSREQVTISIEELGLTREATEHSAKALSEQAKSLKIQNFENTFFNMINLHNEIVNNISIDVKYDFRYYWTKPSKVSISHTKQPTIYAKRKAINEIYLSLNSFMKTYKLKKPTKVYDLCHEVFQDILGHYFGNIYQILKFIHTSKNIDKQKYSSLFRAQFSSQELELLFFHCSGSIGSIKFKTLTEEFSFFEHLNLQNDNFDFILFSNIYEISAFGKNQKSINHVLTVKKRIEDEILNLKVKKDLTATETLSLARNYFYKDEYDLAIDKLNVLKLKLEEDKKNLNSENRNLKKQEIRNLPRKEEIEIELETIKENISQIAILMDDIISEKNSFISSSQEPQ